MTNSRNFVYVQATELGTPFILTRFSVTLFSYRKIQYSWQLVGLCVCETIDTFSSGNFRFELKTKVDVPFKMRGAFC